MRPYSSIYLRRPLRRRFCLVLYYSNNNDQRPSLTEARGILDHYHSGGLFWPRDISIVHA